VVAVPSTDPTRDDDGDDRRNRSRSRHRHRRQRRKGSFWRELPILVVTALVLTLLIQTFLARVYLIPSASMEPTLHGCSGCTNDRVLVDKLSYRFTDPVPGDVIVFRGPESWAGSAEFTSEEPDNIVLRGLQEAAALLGLAPPDEQDFVKRVIAVEGQTVKCCDARNRVVVDGEPLVEPYVYPEGGPQDEFGPVTVPDDHLWVMGDNRNNSADSRRHVDDPRHGTVPIENVIGEARLIVLPPGRWELINDPNPQRVPVTTERR
jgi:signal peptidase I